MKKIKKFNCIPEYLLFFDRKVKITFLLITFMIMGLKANDGLSQKIKISLDVDNTDVSTVLDQIEQTSDYRFVYHTGSVDLSRKVTLKLEQRPINFVLKKLFSNTHTNFKVINFQVILSEKNDVLPLKRDERIDITIVQEPYEINGVVTDADDIPIPGASIVIVGSSNGTATDFDGNYKLMVPNGEIMLEISSIGFNTQTIAVDNRNTVNIIMAEALNQLDDVIVIGYGTQKKSSVTAAVASVDAKEIQKQLTPDVATSIQGRSPGVEVVTNGGVAGAQANIIIRGAGSFSNTEPLYLIDGAISNSGLRNLNPNDIQSIEVLKDGSAAAIYGVRAANGVVLVTTKGGKTGKATFELNTSTSMQSPTRRLEFLNASQYVSFANTVADNSGLEHAPYNDNPDLSVDTDWQDLWLRTAPLQTVDFSASGGSEFNTYRVSAGYLKQDGILRYSSFDKYTFRVNNNFERDKLKISQNLGISRYTNTGRSSSIIGGLLPTVPAFDADGNFVSGGPEFYIEGENKTNPLAQAANRTLRSSVSDFTGSLGLTYELLPSLSYKLQLGGNYRVVNEYDYTPTFYTLFDENGVPDARYGNALPVVSELRGEVFNYTIDNTLNYKKLLGKHNFDVLLGTSWTREFEKVSRGSGFFSEFSNVTSLNGAGNITTDEQGFALFSLFGRFNYQFDDRYLLSATLRRDETSQFSSDNNTGYFPSISVGWNLHNEEFFDFEVIDQLKIRGGYGELGVNSVDQRANFVSTAFGPIPAAFGQGNRILGTITRLANQDLTWETSQSTNVGFDLRLLNSKFKITGDYFVKKNIDLLAQLELLPSVGQTVVLVGGENPFVNAPTVRNKGIELAVGYSKYEGDFTFDLDFNISSITNEVLALGENIQPIRGDLISGRFDDRATITREGLPIGSFIGFRTEGIDENGDFIFQDNNGLNEAGELTGVADGNIDENDKVILGDPFPDFTYGVNFSGNYKNFDFTFFLQGVQGNEIFSQIKLFNYFRYDSDLVVDVLNSWTPENTNTNLPIAKLDNRNTNSLPSDFYIEDGSYLRLKNLQVGYNFDEKISSLINVSKFRMYIGVQNLFTITNYSGYDPEVSTNTLFNRGVDFGARPNARTITLGLNVSF